MKGRPPLDALRKLREASVDARASELAQEQRRLSEAEHRRQALALQRQREQSEAQRVQQSEGERVAGGAARAHDLRAAAEFERGASLREQALQAREAEAASRAEEHRAERDRARRALARADADAEAVRRHGEAWERKREQLQEQSSEEEAADVWQGRHPARGRRA